MKKTVISLPIEKYTFSELPNDLARVRINVYHNSYNPNGSYFEDESFENSKESFKNKPICCAYEYDNNDEIEDFKEHNIEEKPIGVIPETNNYLVESIDDLNWACVDGIVFKEYCPEAYELLKEGKKISMEIEVLDGYKGKDKFYHIKRFNLLCITVLGDSYSPAMGDNATIDLFDNTDSEKFALKFNEIINKANSIGVKSTKGGNVMKRNEIIAKFSALEKVEGYSEIIGDEKLTDEELEAKLFSLSINQLNSFINEALSEKTIIKQYWDGESYETNKYYLEDIVVDEKVAIVWSTEDWKDYGISYSLDGDKATLDFDNVKEYIKGDWRERKEGDSNVVSESFTKEIDTMTSKFKKDLEDVKNSFNVKETEEYKNLEKELEETKAEFTTLKTDKVALDGEVETLRQFKLDKEKEAKELEVNELLDKYSELKPIEGYEELVVDKFACDLNSLETKLKVFAYDHDITINKKKKFNKVVEKPTQLPVDPVSPKVNDSGAWSILDDLVSKN